MALPKLFQRIFWHNNTNPDINEDNLNAMSKGLSDVDDRLISLGGLVMETVPQIQEDMAILGPAVENIDANVARAEGAADDAEAEALKSEGYAVGTQDGVEVTSGEYYQNNAKYFAEIANPPIENTVDFTDVITISDAINKAAKDVKLKVEAVQDLHGYTKPWVGGAGKNKFDVSKIVDNSTVTQSDGVITVKGYAVKPGDPCKLSDLAPTLEIGQTYTLSAVSTSTSKLIYLLGANVRWDFGTSETITQELLNSTVHFYNNGQGEPDAYISDMQIELGTIETDFEPYTNICPITGHSEAKVTRVGKNLFDISKIVERTGNPGLTRSGNSLIVTAYNASSVNALAPNILSAYADLIIGKKYTLSATTTQSNRAYIYLEGANMVWRFGETQTITQAMLDSVVYFYADEHSTATISNIQFELGETATEYEPYKFNGYIIELDGTRYGGTLDVTSGVLTVTKAYDTIDGSKATGIATSSATDTLGGKRINTSITNAKAVSTNVKADIISDKLPTVTAQELYALTVPDVIAVHDAGGVVLRYMGASTLADAQTALNNDPVNIVYELATPQTIQLTPTQVYLLYGYNTLFGDCGDISLTYDASGIIHIDEAKLDTETLKTIAAASSDFADFKARIAAL